jgi:predicted  nucleic acid-binding Zn-ribbon protein
LQSDLDQRRAGSADLKSRWDAAHDAWQHSLGDLRAEVEKLKERSVKIESALSDRLKQDFFRIFKQRQNVAVARVVNDSCSACRTRIRPALFQQLKRGELVHCEGCHRILYLEGPAS